MAGIRLPHLVAFGVHLTYRSPTLFKQQIAYIAKVAAAEGAVGRQIVLAGDWNETEATITANAAFARLNLASGAAQEEPTCPTFLPRPLQKPLDHIFVPQSWQRRDSKTVAFGSDHLALLVDVERDTSPARSRVPGATSGRQPFLAESERGEQIGSS